VLLFAALMQQPAPVTGDRLAPFALADSLGQVQSWRPGRTTVVCVIAYWCDTWKEQFQRLSRAQQALGSSVEFITISTDGRWSELAAGAPEGKRLVDSGRQWSGPLGIDRIPYTFLVDPSGTIRWAKFGVLRSEDLVAKAQRLDEVAPTGDLKVYLTFDDFPAARGSDELLDVLRAEQVSVTFFAIGRNAQARPDPVRRAAREGHSIQMHSWAHSDAQPGLIESQDLIHKLVGEQPEWYRPPGSKLVLRGAERWPGRVVDPYDYRRPGSDELYRRIMLNVSGNSIIQLHAGVPDTLQVMPRLIRALRDRGYRFDVIR